MKPFAIVLLAAAALAASPARADHDRVTVTGSIAIGAPGPVYGVPAYPAPAYYPPAPAYYPPAPAYYPPAPVRYEREHGYWTDMVVKTWVPERWTSSRDRWGRPVRFCEPGHFSYRTERVWVDGRRGNDYRDEHRYGYGYRR